MIKFVLLDLDDTIFDFHAAEHAALSATLAAMDVPVTDETLSRYSEINRAHWEMLERGELTREQVLTQRFDALYRELGISRSSEKTQSVYEYRLSLEHPFIKGAEELLDKISKNYELYIVSNGTAIVQDRRIADSGIGKYFKNIFISQRVGADKPDKRFFDYCFSHIENFSRESAIIVGDSLTSDILGGINAGIKTCRFNPHGKTADKIIPDYEIKTLAELTELLETL